MDYRRTALPANFIPTRTHPQKTVNLEDRQRFERRRWMTVAEVVPITGALVLLGLLGELPLPATFIAAALGAAMIGLAPFNRPV